MGELVDKIKGKVNELVGEAKEALGDHNDDARLKAEGQVQQVKGKGEQIKGSVKGALGDNI
ncbi:CsbD family protein [Sphingomonadaceae bacterium jetA1]|uniref:CsbD family protein n=1 Tax=Facivitalis istanbulensis TaxID=3075838 RepID=UPI0034950A59